jgi:hypothetical protein
MSDDETQPVRPAGTPPAPAGETQEARPEATQAPTQEAGPEPARRGFRERFRTWRGSRDGGRAYSLGALIASALAGIIVGGLGLATVQAVTDDGPRERDGWVQRDDDRGPGDRGPMRGGPRGVPGQEPPTTAPEDDEGSAS